MYFFAITKNKLTNKPCIPCGDSYLVDVDSRYSLENQYYIALDNLEPRMQARNEEFIGIACFKRIGDKRPQSSVKLNDTGFLNMHNLGAFKDYEL